MIDYSNLEHICTTNRLSEDKDTKRLVTLQLDV